jgi:hypothetical protein
MMPYCCHEMTAASAGPSYWLTAPFPVETFSIFWSRDLLLPESYFLGAKLCISRWFESLNGFVSVYWLVCILIAKTAHFPHIWFGVGLFNVGRHESSKPLLRVIVRRLSIAEPDELSGSFCCGSLTSWARRGVWGWLLIFYLPWEDFLPSAFIWGHTFVRWPLSSARHKYYVLYRHGMDLLLIFICTKHACNSRWWWRFLWLANVGPQNLVSHQIVDIVFLCSHWRGLPRHRNSLS